MKRKRYGTPWLYVITFTCAAVWVFGSLFGHFAVKAGNSGGGIATHSFLVEGPTPTPSPEGCVEGPLFATLTGPTIGGQMPRGFAQFREGNHNELKVFVRHVNLPGGTILDVFVEGTLVGEITLRSNGNGQSFLDTNVPIGQGTLLEVKREETVILSGDFFSRCRVTVAVADPDSYADTDSYTVSDSNSFCIADSKSHGISLAYTHGGAHTDTDAPSPTIHSGLAR